jgi:hypothetical protein
VKRENRVSTEKHRPGYRPYVAGSIALGVVGVLVLAGLLFRAPTAEAESIGTLMGEFSLDKPFGMQPTMMQVYQSMVLAAGLLMLGLGFLNLWLPCRDDPDLMRRLILINSVVVGLIVLVYAFNGVSTIFAPLAIAEICFLAALFRSRTAVDSSS